MSDADADAFVDDLFLRFCDLVGVADAARRPLLDVDLPEASDA
jgi:hypothetical protein